MLLETRYYCQKRNFSRFIAFCFPRKHHYYSVDDVETAYKVFYFFFFNKAVKYTAKQPIAKIAPIG